jgi:hypothetical protein
MQPMKLAGITAAALLVGGIFAFVHSAGHAQQTEISTNQIYQPSDMNNFKKPDAAELKKKLTAEQFAVTQEADTEPPFQNE